MEHYLVFLEDKRKSAVDAGYRYEAFIKEPLGGIEVAALKAQQIRNWHSDLVKLAPRLRTRKAKSNSIARSARTRTSKRSPAGIGKSHPDNPQGRAQHGVEGRAGNVRRNGGGSDPSRTWTPRAFDISRSRRPSG